MTSSAHICTHLHTSLVLIGKAPPLTPSRYAEYETKLEELRAHRKEIAGLKGKTTLADYAIVRRIHLIYERATRKFRGDLRVWLKWLHFCRSSGSTRQISRVRLHL